MICEEATEVEKDLIFAFRLALETVTNMETSTTLDDSDKYVRSIELQMYWDNQCRSYIVGGHCRMDYYITV